MFRFATPSLTKKKERSMFPTKALRFVRALYILAAVLPAYGLQLYGQGLDSRPNPIAARAAAARAAAAAKLAAAKGATVGQAITIPPPTAVGTFVTFDVPGAVKGTSPASINSSGAITGSYGDNIGSGFHGFIRAADGSFVTFDVPGVFTFQPSFFINAIGEVAGSYFDTIDGVNFVPLSFLREPNGTLTKFNPPDGVNGSFPSTITPDGVILGVYFDAGFNSLGFQRERSGTFTVITGPGGLSGQWDPYISFGAVLSITPGGENAGTYFQPIAGNPFGGNYRVFLLSKNGQYTTFDAADYEPCCIFSSPSGITPAGTVTGTLNDGHNVYRGFLRTPDGTVTVFDAPGAGTGRNQGTVTIGITPAGVVAGAYLGRNDGMFIGASRRHGFLFRPSGKVRAWQ